MSIPIRVALSVMISIVPSLNIATARADDTIEPPSHSAYAVTLAGADLAGSPTFSIKIGASLEDSKPKPTPTPVEVDKTAQIAPQRQVASQQYDPSSIQGIARQLVDQAWGDDQWDAFSWIVNDESGWNPTAEEPSSHAYGLGQALPASKMRGFGDDYLSNPVTQLRWMISYIKDRYGNPAAAFSFHLANHWY